MAQSQQEETNKKLARLEETLQGLVSSFTANKLKELQGGDGHTQRQGARQNDDGNGAARTTRSRRRMQQAQPNSVDSPGWHPDRHTSREYGGADGPETGPGSPSKRHLTSSRRRRLKALAAKSARGEVPMTYRDARGAGSHPTARASAKLGVDGSSHSYSPSHSQRRGSRYHRERRKPPLPAAPVRVGREVYAKPKQAVTGYAAGVAVRDLGRAGEMVVSQPRYIYGRDSK